MGLFCRRISLPPSSYILNSAAVELEKELKDAIKSLPPDDEKVMSLVVKCVPGRRVSCDTMLTLAL